MTTENFDTQREVCYTNTCLSCAYRLKCGVNVLPFLALHYVTVLCINKTYQPVVVLRPFCVANLKRQIYQSKHFIAPYFVNVGQSRLL